jgi:hypothetical protein
VNALAVGYQDDADAVSARLFEEGSKGGPRLDDGEAMQIQASLGCLVS